MPQKITREQLKAKLDSGQALVLLEALPEDSYRRAHLPGAIRIPNEEPIEKWAPRLIPSRDAQVVTYCANFI